MPKKLLVDSDVFFALGVISDANHLKATHLRQQFFREKRQLSTLNLVIFETATLVSHRIGQKEAVIFLTDIFSGEIEVIKLDDEIERKAIEFFKKQTRKNTSFVDCANMAVMEQFGLTSIFSFDEIYKRNGFKRLGIDR